MVELDVLEALDGIQWLGSGEEVAKRFSISQATVSRYCTKALEVFDLRMERQNAEWEMIGEQTFLRMEREVHQHARRLGYRPLRLEATYWSAPTICANLPANWILGRSNIVGVKRNCQLVQDRVVDCWIAGLPDLPTSNQAELSVIPLTRMPVFFTCAPNHPLLARARITYSDIAEYPTLALPSGSYPLVEKSLKSLGLWNDAVRMSRYRRDKWEGKTEQELVIGYGTPLSMKVSGGKTCRLPLLLPFESGDALVARKDFLAHSPLTNLIASLLAALDELAREDPEITITFS